MLGFVSQPILQNRDRTTDTSMEDLKPFGLGDFVSLITKYHLCFWGNELCFECVYDPISRKPYKIIFFNCTKIIWSIYSPENTKDTEADIIDIQLGKDKFQQPAIIYTNIFELSILYESLKVEKDW